MSRSGRQGTAAHAIALGFPVVMNGPLWLAGTSLPVRLLHDMHSVCVCVFQFWVWVLDSLSALLTFQTRA